MKMGPASSRYLAPIPSRAVGGNLFGGHGNHRANTKVPRRVRSSRAILRMPFFCTSAAVTAASLSALPSLRESRPGYGPRNSSSCFKIAFAANIERGAPAMSTSKPLHPSSNPPAHVKTAEKAMKIAVPKPVLNLCVMAHPPSGYWPRHEFF